MAPFPATCLIFTIISCIAELLVALIALHSTSLSTTIGLFFASFAVLLVAFALLALPLKLWHTRLMVRLMWVGVSVCGTAALGLNCGILGSVVPSLLTCWNSNPNTCGFECSVAVTTTMTVATVVASFGAAVGCLLIVAGIYATYAPYVKLPFSSDLSKDFDLHSVALVAVPRPFK